MPEILTESFCERCGTRYTFESAAPRVKPLRGLKVLGRGLKNFVLSDDSSVGEAMAAARGDAERAVTTQQLDAFHTTFNFCMSCRQYTCANCWNEAEGKCLTCSPHLGREIMPAPFSTLPAHGPVSAIADAPEGSAGVLDGPTAWPEFDMDALPEPEAVEVVGAVEEYEEVEEIDLSARLRSLNLGADEPQIAPVEADAQSEAIAESPEADRDLAAQPQASAVAEPADAVAAIETEPEAVAERVEAVEAEPEAVAKPIGAVADVEAEPEAVAEPIDAFAGVDAEPVEAEAEAVAEPEAAAEPIDAVAEVEAVAEPIDAFAEVEVEPVEAETEAVADTEAVAEPVEAVAEVESERVEAVADVEAEPVEGVAEVEAEADAIAEPVDIAGEAESDAPAERVATFEPFGDDIYVERAALESGPEEEIEEIDLSARLRALDLGDAAPEPIAELEVVAWAQPEPDIDAVAQIEAVAEAETEPETVAGTEPEAAAEPVGEFGAAAEPEAVAEPVGEFEAAAEPEAVAEPETSSEPDAVAEPRASGSHLIGQRSDQTLEEALAAFERAQAEAPADLDGVAEPEAVAEAESDVELEPVSEPADVASRDPEPAVAATELTPEPQAEPVLADAEVAPEAEIPGEASPAPAGARTEAPSDDRIAQPVWLPVAPEADLPADGIAATAAPAPESQPTTPPEWPAQPQWPNQPQWPSAPRQTPRPNTILGRPVVQGGGIESLWAASNREVLGAAPAGNGPLPGGKPAPAAAQPCVNCGLSLSATARFCRRCGTPQTQA